MTTHEMSVGRYVCMLCECILCICMYMCDCVCVFVFQIPGSIKHVDCLPTDEDGARDGALHRARSGPQATGGLPDRSRSSTHCILLHPQEVVRHQCDRVVRSLCRYCQSPCCQTTRRICQGWHTESRACSKQSWTRISCFHPPNHVPGPLLHEKHYPIYPAAAFAHPVGQDTTQPTTKNFP